MKANLFEFIAEEPLVSLARLVATSLPETGAMSALCPSEATFRGYVKHILAISCGDAALMP